jgi:hypothetical protein
VAQVPVGVLSTGLLFEQLVRGAPDRSATMQFQTVVDRLPIREAGDAPVHGTLEMLST